MNDSNVAGLAKRYYKDFASSGGFEAIPMAEDLRFTGPIYNYADGARYRKDCVELAKKASGLTIRHQFFDGDRVHTVYDLDLGLPSGPIMSSETLTFADGAIAAVELVFDSAPLRAMVEGS